MVSEIILIYSYFTFRFQPSYGKIYHLCDQVPYILALDTYAHDLSYLSDF